MNKKLLITIGIILLVTLTAGLTALAASNYGSRSDPLVALSYLNTTVTPGIMDKLGDMVDDKAAELKADFDDELDSVTPGQSSDSQAFKVVSLKSGQTLTGAVGTEIMLRIGTAVTAGPDSPRLIDETTGADAAAEGAALEKNHMYMVSIAGNGIKATANAKVLVRGDYTIG